MVIDGIADLIGAVNNEQESVELIEGSNRSKIRNGSLSDTSQILFRWNNEVGNAFFYP